jgi:ABC-type transport system substrate-binding protein
MYNGLLGRDERGDPVPDLAESWTVEQAGAVYRFRRTKASMGVVFRFK